MMSFVLPAPEPPSVSTYLFFSWWRPLVVAPSRVIVWSKLPLGLAEPGLEPASRGVADAQTEQAYGSLHQGCHGGDDPSISL